MNAQEQFWSGSFGSEYTRRNRVSAQKRIPFWTNVLGATQARSVLDVGCNAGWNLQAIKSIDPTIVAAGIDVNSDAVGEARSNELDARVASIYQAAQLFPAAFDLVCTSGVLIHIPPESLREAMLNIIAASKRWVLAVEYESSEEEEIVYRGNTERLWKRPFGRLYENLGLETVVESDAQGFDRCRTWLMVKR
jgi:pseudaminic acid biosynthesis-associated methylase